MSWLCSWLLGPEGLWVVICLFAYLAAVSNNPSTPAGNEFLESLWIAIPLVGVPLTFLTGYLPGGWSGRWLLRLIVASLFGVVVASFLAASGVDYHDSRNSGLMAAPFYSLTIGLFVLIPGAAIAAIAAILLFWRRNKAHGRG
ncbi:conserved membrane protein of unknown function [Nitrospira japonica]|uniref:Uncharacterized protein n=1 Tax=Nitrospira japonica TaxID=1325564 RepID=A0A1W1I7F0_9BACT|nr:hypothetical protein [Nitrospira japonica]SLM48733.1 conserved membrane protein of unknown function [Nitrospira japonica]